MLVLAPGAVLRSPGLRSRSRLPSCTSLGSSAAVPLPPGVAAGVASAGRAHREEGGAISRDDFQIIEGVDPLKVLAHPDRLRILAMLREEPLTATMVAQRLGMPANRAHYHLKSLLDVGLVRLHRTGRRRWKEEKFYIATARHFLIDPGLACDAEGASDALRRTASQVFASLRRDRILGEGLATVAARVVGDCLRIARGELVLVTVNAHTLELAEALAVEIEARGGRVHWKPWSREIVLRTIDRHTRESLAVLPFIDRAVDAELAACIHIASTVPSGAPPTEAQRALLPLRLSALTEWHRSLRDRNLRYVEISLPHRDELAGMHTTAEEGLDTFWRTFAAEPAELRARAEALIASARRGPGISLARPGGGTLTAELDLSRTRICDGLISEEDLAARQAVDNFPTGGLSLLPRRGTAAGALRADYAFVAGRHIREIDLEVAAGRLVSISAAEGSEVLRNVIREAVGDAESLAEIAIGLNPAGRRLTGKATLDSCLEGVVTVTFGNNELLGGDIHSTLTLNLPCEGLTVRSGEETWIEAGRVVLGG